MQPTESVRERTLGKHWFREDPPQERRQMHVGALSTEQCAISGLRRVKPPCRETRTFSGLRPSRGRKRARQSDAGPDAPSFHSCLTPIAAAAPRAATFRKIDAMVHMDN
eukprot:4711850-Pleurochrysis_carterae.AAC.2